MTKGTYVYCTTQFEGFHRWPNPSSDVKFLANLHRHMFHVKVWVKVKHDDRDMEFIGLKRNIDSICNQKFPDTFSCEQIAKAIVARIEDLGDIKIHSVEVSEDGEYGAIVVC